MISDIINNPYNVINLILPDIYEKTLYFTSNIIRKDDKRVLRTFYRDKYLFYNDYFNEYIIFLYSEVNDSILYYINDTLYYKILTIDERNLLLDINNLELNYNTDIIRECIKTDKLIKIDYDTILKIYNQKHKDTMLNILLQHEIKCMIDSEYRRSYFEKMTIIDEGIPIYLPIRLELYFIMNELYNRKYTNNNNLNLNLNINIKFNNNQMDNFLSNALTMYSLISNQHISSFDIDYNIIKNAYIRFSEFMKEENKLDNNIDIITHHNIYNLHMNTFRNIINNMDRKMSNKTQKMVYKTKGGRGKTKKHRGTL